jgi:beta-glucanase (GH16 family)
MLAALIGTGAGLPYLARKLAIRTSTIRLALAACALAACAVMISSCSGGSTPCGSTEHEKSSGGSWVCSFEDDFSGTTLDPAKWQVMTTATTGFTQPSRECYVNDPAHIKVADGLLTLTATKLSSPVPCGSMTSLYLSGMIFTKHRFAQTFGRFEVRAKLPPGTGFQPALWMYPQDLAYGDRSGEIDIAESFGAPNVVSPHIHMRDSAGVDRAPGAYCQVANPSETFHTYAVEWLPSNGFRFLYDGVPCMTLPSWDPGAPLVAPQPFDKPFFILLQLGLGFGANAPTAGTHFPQSLEIDYVRAWK